MSECVLPFMLPAHLVHLGHPAVYLLVSHHRHGRGMVALGTARWCCDVGICCLGAAAVMCEAWGTNVAAGALLQNALITDLLYVERLPCKLGMRALRGKGLFGHCVLVGGRADGEGGVGYGGGLSDGNLQPCEWPVSS